MCFQPVISNVADVFTWKPPVVTIASNAVPTNKSTQQIKTLPDSFFCLMAFRASTNYDNFSGDLRAVIGAGPAAATRIGTPPRVPNNFEVFIRRQDINWTGIPVPQAVIASNGYFAGAQVPFPVLYSPATVIYFDFYNVVPTVLQTTAGANISLQIDFGLFGYNVPVENLKTFLASYPALRESMARAFAAGKLPAENLTAIAIKGLTPSRRR